MRRLGVFLARTYVAGRHLFVLLGVGGAVAAAILLAPIPASGGSVSQLVPKHAQALQAEKLSARLFAFPLATQTDIVVRNPRGLSSGEQSALVQLALKLSRHQVPGFASVLGALPLTNAVGEAPFAREHNTAAVLYLYFGSQVSAHAQTELAQRLAQAEIPPRPGQFVGVSGEAPAQSKENHTINVYLPWVELATIVLVAGAIALHFRALLAPLLVIVSVAIAFVMADRAVEQVATLGGLSVPAAVRPVLVVLVFGVVTDYSVFFLSRFRTLLRAGETTRAAAVGAVGSTAPIVFAAGVTVAAGTIGLVAATLGFLRAFGPGLAVAVLVAMAVAILFVPAAMAALGPRVFWPSNCAPASAPTRDSSALTRTERLRRAMPRNRVVSLAVHHPAAGALLAIAIVGGCASGLFRLALGDETISGLPSGAPAELAASQATLGFSPGVLAPTEVIVRGSGVSNDRAALAQLERELRRQPGVVGVLGPADAAFGQPQGFAVSSSGGAARFALFLDRAPTSAGAMSDVSTLQSRLPSLLHQAGLTNATTMLAGNTALAQETVAQTVHDLGRVTPAVLGLIFIVMLVFLRALVAPLYLVATSVLAALGGLGLTVYLFQIELGYGQITYFVIFMVAVLLVSLGSDYNVFLVGRVWQSARSEPFAKAVEDAGSAAARPIRVAGLILAGSFALLAIVPLRAFREVAFAMATGLLLDAFVVRALLVPAVMKLVGPVSAWPRRRLRRSPTPAPRAIGGEAV